MGIPDSLYLPPLKPVCRSRSNSWNRTWNNRLVQNQERSMYVKAVYCHPVHLTYMHSTLIQNARLDQSQAGIKKLLGEISTTSDMQVILR